MGYRTHFKWLDSHFRSPTLKGCFIIFIPHDTSCGCGGGIWSQTKLPQALALLLSLVQIFPFEVDERILGFPCLKPMNSTRCHIPCLLNPTPHFYYFRSETSPVASVFAVFPQDTPTLWRQEWAATPR